MSTIACLTSEHSARAVVPSGVRNRKEPRSSAHRYTVGSHCGCPPALTRSACRYGSVRPWRRAGRHPHRPPGNSKFRAKLFRSSQLPSSPWLGSLLEGQAAEPALLPASGEQIAQHQPRSQQPRLDRSDRNSQSLGGLLNIQLFHVPQNKHFTILSIERGQRLRQLLPDLLSLQRLGRNLPPVGKVPRCIVAFFLSALVDGFHSYRSLSSPPHQRFVDRNLDQPGAEARLRSKLPDIRECLQHRLLGHILGVGLVAQNGERCSVNPPFVGLDQFVEELAFPAPHARDQLLLARRLLLRLVQDRVGLGHLVSPRQDSGSFFQPVSIDRKLFHPCRSTMTRCPNTKAISAHMT